MKWIFPKSKCLYFSYLNFKESTVEQKINQATKLTSGVTIKPQNNTTNSNNAQNGVRISTKTVPYRTNAPVNYMPGKGQMLV